MATPSATPPRLPPLPVLTNNVLHGPSSSIPEGHNTTCPSSFFPVFVGAGCDVPEHKLQLGFSPARLFSLLSLLPLFLSVPSAFSAPSVLNPSFLVFLLSVNSAFSVCSALNPSFLLFLLSVNSAFSVCSALSLFFWSRHTPLPLFLTL